MRNVIYALAAGLVVFAALYVPGVLRLGEAIVPGVLGAVGAYYLLARRVFKRVEALFTESAKALQTMPPKLDLAIQTLEKAYVFGPVQFGVQSQVDTQVGVIHFLQKDFNKAIPFLQRSVGFGHWMGAAMLAVAYYKRKDHEKMRATLGVLKRKGKKESLAWSLNAYLLCQIGDRDAAQSVLTEGVKATKEEQKVKDALLAVQNGRKIKMKAYKEQWYQFQLERPPMEYQQVAVGGKMGKAARRGRW